MTSTPTLHNYRISEILHPTDYQSVELLVICHDISSFGIDRLADVTMSIVHIHFIAVISMEIDEYHPD